MTHFDELDVAVVGVAGRFPGAPTVGEFWRNLRQGIESIRPLTDDELRAAGVDAATIQDPAYVRNAAVLDGVELFDAGFFGYSPREASVLDPQCRLFLECAWEALETAGYDPQNPGASVGVYAGESISTYLLGHLHSELTLRQFTLAGGNIHALLGNCNDFLTTRVSYKLNLGGPSLNVQTACSSSLVAVHLARQALLAGECDMALAGGVSIYLPQGAGYRFQEGMILSPDGRCRPFDAEAAGTNFGRGVGLVVLKPLAAAVRDGDDIYAVIKGSAINNDGAGKVGYTAPGVDGQARVIAEALANAGVDAESISYVEAHGTGTQQGDPLEIAALTRAFRGFTERTQYCGIGSVKGNIGHLDAAAGVAGFIKTVLMLRNKERAPSVNYTRPNPQIDFANSPFYVHTALDAWPAPAGPRRAGVSSFGMGGTNAHVVLEEAPALDEAPAAADRPAHVLTIGAKTARALCDSAARLAGWLRSTAAPHLADACYTSNVGRAHFAHRAAIVVRSREGAIESLDAVAAGRPAPLTSTGVVPRSQPRLAFLFTGQGAQYSGMGRGLYEHEPVFRDALDRCAHLLRDELDIPLLSVMFDERHAARLDQTQYTQPALFALEYALVELWRSWGVAPSVVMGHSLGEDIAASVAGVFSLDDGLRLIAARARLMQALPQDGEMVSLLAPETRVRAAVAPHAAAVSIAALNGPENVVISGERGAVRAIVAELEAEGIKARPLVASHAFHSPLMEPMLDPFEAIANRVRYAAPAIPLVSNVTADVAAPELVCDPSYWRRHVRETVRFAEGMAALLRQEPAVLLEIGPTPTLLALGRRCVPEEAAAFVPSIRRGRDEVEQMMESLAALYAAGVDIDWRGVHQGRRRRRVALPTYPFQRERHWIEPRAAEARRPAAREARLVGRRLASPVVAEAVFETEISLESVPFVADHRVGGAVVFPGTGFLELAFEAAESLADGRVRLENIAIDQALVVTEAPVTVQTIFTPPVDGRSTFRIFARRQDERADAPWTLHASGEAVAGARASQGAGVGAADWIERARGNGARQMTGEEFYAGLAREGFAYGPAFQGITQIWWRNGDAVARVDAERAQAELERYRAHPAVFDGGLQLVLAAIGQLDAGGACLHLPVAMGAVDVCASLAGVAWSRAEITRADGTSFLASITMVDDEGRIVATVRDVRLIRVAGSTLPQPHPADGRLFEMAWEAKAPPPARPAGARADFLPPVHALAARVRPTLDAMRPRVSAYDGLLPELDRLCTEYVCAAFRGLGWRGEPGERLTSAGLASRLGVQPRHVRMLERTIEMLAEDGFVAADGDGWRVERRLDARDPGERAAELVRRFPECGAELTLTTRCGEQLGAVLTGAADPLQVLFPDGSSHDLEQLYREAPLTRAYNSIVRDAVGAALEHLPRDRKIRILEIGAGTGGTSTFVLPALPADRTDYVFTDVSTLFMVRARQRFSGFPFVSYRALDIDKDPLAQGYRAHEFDLVLATNVLHATADLHRTMGYVRELLAPGGVLMAVEGICRQRWVDIIFGLTDGWWKATDTALRGTYPLISREKWQDLLGRAGFVDAVSVPAEPDEPLCQHAVLMATAPAAPAAEAARDIGPIPDYIVFGSPDGAGRHLQQRLSAHQPCRLIVPAAEFAIRADGVVTVDPARSEHFRQALDILLPGGEGCRAIVHAAAADASPEPRSLEELRSQQAAQCGSLLALTQALADRSAAASPLWVATRGSQAVVAEADPETPAAAALWGMARVITQEHPELRCTIVDLDPAEPIDTAVSRLAVEVQSSDEESQIAWRGDRRFVARLSSAGVEPAAAAAEKPPVSLVIASRGVLDRLEARPVQPRTPGAGEVAIRVAATGLNLKDVLNALGTYPGDPGPLGLECAGVVTAVGAGVTTCEPGDDVLAIAPGSFGTVALAPAPLVVRKPAALSMEQAATLPTAFLTAYYALHRLARIARGDRVLIHAAAGGVGMAAVQIAVRAGAEVFATAGTPDKRALVRGLGAAHVMDSRSLTFAGEILRLTGGRGVDVVLNSLAGEFIDHSFDAIARGGRFVELGKTATWDAARVAALGRDIEYHVVDVQETSLRELEAMGALLREIVSLVERGDLSPLPVRTFAFEDVAAAFRFMAQARHVGKIAVVQPSPAARAAVVRREASYLITGGFGGLGLLFARWLAERGATHLALVGRRAPSGEAARAIESLRGRGVEVQALVADVSRSADVHRTLETVGATMPPLRGVLHAAGTLDDGAIAQQRWSRFERVMAAKVDGAWLLHEHTRRLGLDWFVLFSSVASVLGSRGQANHSAANAFMDALAAARRRQGLPGLSISWPAWARVGAAAEGQVLDRLAALGLGAIEPEEGEQLFEALLQASVEGRAPAHVAVMPVDWATFVRTVHAGRAPAFLARVLARGSSHAPAAPAASADAPAPSAGLIERLKAARPIERGDLVGGYIRQHVVCSLGLDPSRPLDVHQPLSELGLDSLMAVELRSRIGAGLGVARSLPATLLFDYPTVAQLSTYLCRELMPEEAAPAALPDDGNGRAAAVAAVAGLTDQEAEALLLAELSRPRVN